MDKRERLAYVLEQAEKQARGDAPPSPLTAKEWQIWNSAQNERQARLLIRHYRAHGSQAQRRVRFVGSRLVK